MSVKDQSKNGGTKIRATRSRDNTRARLIEAGASVFARRGFGGATIDDLVNAADFTRGAFYSNFSSKEDLFAEVLTEYTDLVIDSLIERVRLYGELTDIDAATRAVLMGVRQYARTLFALRAEAERLAVENERIRVLYLAERSRLEQGIVEALLIGGAVKFSAEPSIQFIASAMMALYSDALTLERLGGTSPATLLQEVVPALVEAGIRYQEARNEN